MGPPRDRGQSSVEFVAVVPLLLIAALAAGQWLAAGSAQELAHHAAEAGAVALLEGTGAADAARDSVPGADRDRLHVAVEGRRVTVTVRAQAVLPGMGDLLAARSVAVAGGHP